MSGHLSNLKRRLAAGLLALTTAVGLGGLTACNNDSSSHDADGINIVASTNVYGSIAKAIAGDKATVHSIIKDPSADPHSYEASPNDIATLKDADIAIVNGGGYDEFAVNALADHDQKNVITAYSFLKDAPPTPRTPISTTTRAQTNTSTLMRRDTTITTTTVKAPTSTSSTIWTLLKTLHPLLPRN